MTLCCSYCNVFALSIFVFIEKKKFIGECFPKCYPSPFVSVLYTCIIHPGNDVSLVSGDNLTLFPNAAMKLER